MLKPDNKKISLSIIFPAFNEQDNIIKSVKSAVSFAKKSKIDYEIIVVDDGSYDKTAQNVAALSSEDSDIKLLRHRVNQGYGAAVYTGLKAARKDLVFFTDSDLQFDINELDTFLDKIKTSDAVFGYRRKRSEGFFRQINVLGWKVVVYSLLGIKLRDLDCAFKLFRKKVLDETTVKSKGATFSAELAYKVIRGGYRMGQLPVNHFKRLKGNPTGANLSVILKAFKEIWQFYLLQPRLVRSRSRIIYAFSILGLLLSRLLLMSRSADFFDAPEYMWRTVEPTLFKAMSTGHSPFHPLYVFFSYLIYKSGLTFGSTLTATILPSVILGSFSVVLVFLLIKNLFNSKIAWICTVLYGLLPFVFISQITALVDPTEHFFYFLSLYLLVLALEKHRQEYLLALLAGLSFGLAAFAHTQVAFWALGLISVLIIKNDDWQKANIKKIFFKIVLFCLGGSVFLFAYLQILVSASSREHLNVYNYKDALKLMLFDNTGERNPLVVTRFLRQFATVATSLVLVSSLIGFILMLKDKLYKQATALVLWFLPGAAITSTYIYENLHGRAMIIALVPVLVFVSYFILRVRLKFAAIIFALILAQILIILIPQLYLYHFVVSPNQNLSDLQRNSKPDGLFISSNVTRTLSAYNGSFVSLGDLGSGQAQKLVETTLSQNKPAYVSSDALRMPLRRFDGHFYDIRSTEINGATGHPSLLFGLLNNYDLVLDNFSNLYPQQVYRIYQSAPDTATSDALAHLDKESIVFGQILSNGKPVSSAAVNQYNPVFCKVPNEDQTRLDAAFCLSRYFTGFEEATDWTYTGKDGKFYLPVKDDNFNLVIGPSSTNTRSDDLGTQFAVQEPLSFVGQEIGVFTELSQLQDSINSLSSSYYVFAERSNEKNTYILFRVDFSLPKSGKIEARDLSGEIGEIIKDNSIGEEVRSNVKTATGGFLSSGPYVNLPKGEYQIDFSVRSKVKEGTPNLNFDVFSSDTGKTYVEKNVSVSSLKSDQYQTVSLIFSLSASTNLIEFRLKTGGDTETYLNFIELKNK